MLLVLVLVDVAALPLVVELVELVEPLDDAPEVDVVFEDPAVLAPLELVVVELRAPVVAPELLVVELVDDAPEVDVVFEGPVVPTPLVAAPQAVSERQSAKRKVVVMIGVLAG